MNIKDVKKVLIIGSGTMGQQIGFQSAIHGFKVAMYDIGQEALDMASKRMEKLARGFVSCNRLSEDQVKAALNLVTMTTDKQEAGKDADFISESVPEDPALKGGVFAEFNEICPERAVFTTNTSSLVPSMFADATGRPEKFAAFHFHDIRLNNIVDIMPHPGTAEETVDLIRDFAQAIGQIPIMLKKENFGYVFNAMIMDLFKSAQTLAANDVASVEDVDRAWMGVMSAPIGPFGIVDSIGIDTVWKITDYWAGKTRKPQQIANAEFLKQYVDRGHLGQKTGKGFYEYPGPEFGKPDFIK